MLYSVTVKPNSKKGPLVIADGANLTVYLCEKPVDGEANSALIKILAKHFHVPKTSITIQRGGKSRQKIINIPD